jgi:putative ABC transport system permease protein
MTLTWLRGLIVHRGGRIAATAAGVAVAVALLASIGSFLSSSTSKMTARAIQRVPVDWQVEAQKGADPSAVLRAVRSAAGVRAALPVGLADTTGLSARTGGSLQTTGPGVVVGLPPGYASTFPGELRPLSGKPGGVLLAQQTAANLHAKPGDRVSIGRAGMKPVRVTIDGVVDLPAADSLFQKVGAPVGAQPQAPPDNVLIVPSSQFRNDFAGLAKSDPAGVRTQVHARIDHALPHSPASAFTSVSGQARNLETKLAGGGLAGDNLGSALDKARADALYANILFLFLGVPGAVLAGLLTQAVAAAAAGRRRRDQALLRTRGASRRQLVRIALGETALVAGAGIVAGLGLAALVGRLAFGGASFGSSTAAALLWGGGAALAGLAVATIAIALPARRDARELTVAAARQAVGRGGRPRWARYGLDFLLLAISGVLFWSTSRNGYKLVLAPEGIPQISVNYWAFLAPATAWLGLGLLTLRLSDLLLTRGGAATRRFARPFAGNLAGTVAATMSRQRRTLGWAVMLVSLTLAFAISTAVFNATYKQQAEVDAVLTNGAPVAVTESPGVAVGPPGATQIAAVQGVASVEPLQHRFAYVGADLQDLYGVRPSTIVKAGELQDAYFQGGSASQLMGRLGRQPDAVLLSDETVKDFQLHQGDRVTLRLQDGRTKRFAKVPFTYVGVAKEFPTAPSDSFIVANAGYVAKKTGSDAVGTFLVQTGAPGAVGRALQSKLATSATVTDVSTDRRIIGSSLTAVELGGLTKVELAFALALAAAAGGLVLGLGLAERRRTFAIARALGARRRALGAFVYGEAAYVLAGGLALGALGGTWISYMLVKVLTGVFDPPPSAAAVPWTYLVAVAAATIAAVGAAAAGTVRAARRRPIVETLREL